MIHYSCDMCGRPIHPEDELRYVVKIEVYPTDEPEDENDEFDEVGSSLADFDLQEDRESDEEDVVEDDDLEYKTLRFDLCSECHKIYIRDPLSIKSYRSRFFNN